MIIRFDEQLKVEDILAENSVNIGNNLTNEIKVFMPENFDLKSYTCYLNFELSDGKQYNNIPTTKKFVLNEKNKQEECFYYPVQKFLSKQKGTLKLSARISPISDISIIANTGVIETNIYYAITATGDEIIDPTTEENLRQEIHDMEITTQTNLQLYVDENYGDIDRRKMDKNFTGYNEITEINDNNYFVVNNSAGDAKKISSSNLLNSKNIKYSETNVEESLNILNKEVSEKADIEDVVYYRDGSLEDSTYISTGLLNHITDVDGNHSFIELTDSEFNKGDLIYVKFLINVSINDDGVITDNAYSDILFIKTNENYEKDMYIFHKSFTSRPPIRVTLKSEIYGFGNKRIDFWFEPLDDNIILSTSIIDSLIRR